MTNQRRNILKAAWATPVVAAISLPKHAQATEAEVYPTPQPTVEPTTTIPVSVICTDNPEQAILDNINANEQGELTDNGQVINTSNDVYHEPMQDVFTGGTIFIEATDGTLLPDTDVDPSNPNYDAQESADINATLKINPYALPCFIPEQKVSLCLEVLFENLGPDSTYQGGTGIAFFYPNQVTGIVGSGSQTITGNSSKLVDLCHEFTAQELVDGVVMRITAETHQFSQTKAWNITGQYSLEWMGA